VTNTDTAYQVTLMIKITLAVLSGVFAAVHSVGRTKLAVALGGSLGGLFAIAALFFGILLTNGG
jgi:hypothetical protein